MSPPTIAPFRYTNVSTPNGYHCQGCKASGVRLYRDYQTFLEHQQLLCTACAEKAGSEPRKVNSERPHQIGWMVAAVPTEDGATFWGFTSAPQAGVVWWDALPVTSH